MGDYDDLVWVLTNPLEGRVLGVFSCLIKAQEHAQEWAQNSDENEATGWRKGNNWLWTYIDGNAEESILLEAHQVDSKAGRLAGYDLSREGDT